MKIQPQQTNFQSVTDTNKKLSKKDTVDVNILLNRVKKEKNSELKKNLIISAGVASALAVTGFIAIL